LGLHHEGGSDTVVVELVTTIVDVEVVKSTDDVVTGEDSGIPGAVAFVNDEAQDVEESADAVDAVDSVMSLTAADVLEVAGIVFEVTDVLEVTENEVAEVLDSTEIVGVIDVVVVGPTDIAVEADMLVAMEIEFITYDGAATDVVAESVSV